MNVLVVITDGRQPQTISETLESAQIKLRGEFDRTFIINDSADNGYAGWLAHNYPMFTIINHASRRGLGGAVRSAWETALSVGADYVVHLEDDMRIVRKVHVERMIQLLHCEPHLASLTLKRQPWSTEEINAGGQIEYARSVGVEMTDKWCPSGEWVEHSQLFSFNPCLIRRRAIEVALERATDTLERGVTDALVADGWKFAYWGNSADAPRVEHVGHTRSSGYHW